MSEKLDVLRLAFYTAPVSCAILLPLFYIREVITMSSSKGVTNCSLSALTEQHEIVSISFHVRLPRVKHIDLHSSDIPV